MATTVRQLLNRVLTNIAEDNISAVVTEITDAYQLQVLGWLNTIKNEVEDATNWRALWVTNTVSVVSPNVSTTVSWANDRSRIVRIQDANSGAELALAFDITDTPSVWPVYEQPISQLIYAAALNAGQSVTYPTSFAINNTAGGVIKLATYPPATGNRTIQLTLVVPQDSFTKDDLDTVISIPDSVLEVGTTWYALEDRGEELGPNSLFSEQRYRTALNDAIARDEAERGPTELVPT